MLGYDTEQLASLSSPQGSERGFGAETQGGGGGQEERRGVGRAGEGEAPGDGATAGGGR